jgi:hypothetical protein
MTTMQRVKSEGVFYVNLYHRNVSEQNLELLSNRSNTTMSYLLQFLENCTASNAGTFSSVRERFLDLEGDEDDEATGEVREMHRELSLSYCPSSCSNSGSAACRRIGCAYCGRCRRRRRERGRKLLVLVNATNVGFNGTPASAYPLGVRSSGNV